MLRKIWNSLKKENFTFAVIELLMIIVGVFIAFQVDQWNDERKEARDQYLWLEAVREDLGQSVPFIQGRIAYEGQMISALDEVLRALKSGEVPAAKRAAFERGLQQRFITPSPFQLIGTIQQLNVSGQMNDIRDPNLRQRLIGLVGYAAAYDKNISGIEDSFRRATYHSAEFYTIDLDLETGRPVMTSFNLEAMRSDPQFKMDIIYLRNLHTLTKGANETFVKRIGEVIEALDQALEPDGLEN